MFQQLDTVRGRSDWPGPTWAAIHRQSLYDSLRPGAGVYAPPLRLILCGSAISVMGDLLSGTKALRGGRGGAESSRRRSASFSAVRATSLAHQLAMLASAGF